MEGKVETKNNFKWKGAKIIPLISVILICCTLIFIVPTPIGLSSNAWKLFSIFISTIIGLIIQPLPIGAVSLLGLVACLFMGATTVASALAGFGSQVVWLIAMAFMLARGFIKTGLGARIAYVFVSYFGKSTIGLAYSLTFTELILAPAMPSNTARGAGIIFPIITSLSKEYGSTPENNTQRKIGSYLIKLLYQVNVTTSAMFMTAMAANPLVASLASKSGIEITWNKWALACSVPGLINLLVLPIAVFILHKPDMVNTPEAPKFAEKKLKEIGALKIEEIIMFCVFLVLLVMWVFGEKLNINPTSAAIMGLVILLITGVLTWDDVTKESGAWDTFIWMAILIMMSDQLEKSGMMKWLGFKIESMIGGFSWSITIVLVAFIYYYTHYLFASMTAHVTSLFSILLVAAIASGAPAFVSAMLLGAISSLCAGITHYGTGSAPVFFRSNYLTITQWWSVGFGVSVVSFIIWILVGGIWWKFLGYW